MLNRLHARLKALLRADIRHIGGFLIAGGTAFLVDVSVLYVLTDFVGIQPLLARPFSILTAMGVSWWLNRTLTFEVDRPPSIAEFLQFAAVVWISQAVNYVIFAAILLVMPTVWPTFAVAAATSVSMVVSYFGYRFGVFRNSGKSHT